MTDDEVKVCFVIGKGRSGSTLLDGALGQLEGWFSAGELWRLWDWGVDRSYLCGCGAPIPECDVWSGVLARLRGSQPSPEPQATVARAFSWKRLLDPRPDREADHLFAALYRAIAEETGATVIVDSSKWAMAPGIRSEVDGIDPFVVQLVRDPAAVAFSWTRSKAYADREEGEMMPRFGAAYSVVSWTARNLLGEAARRRVGPSRSQLLRYEDFTADPGGTLRRIASACGSRADTGAPPGQVLLGPHHMIGGNPSRGRAGFVEVRADEEWKTAGDRRSRRLVSLVSAPLRRRYGYRDPQL